MIAAIVFGAALRIVSLAPSLTEDLFAIGAGPAIVGVDTYSNYPQAARRLPKVGALTGASVERIIEMRPTLVVGITYQRPLLAQLQRYGIATFASDDDTLDDLYLTLNRLGIRTGRERQSRALVLSMQSEIRKISAKADDLPRNSSFPVIAVSPIYTAGTRTFITTLLKLARLDTVVTIASPPWPQFSAEALEVSAPATIVTSASEKLPQAAPWNALPAVRNNCVFTLNADAFLRPSPRFPQALLQLIQEREARRTHC
jgi:iron complex transport system substrate-binding protein